MFKSLIAGFFLGIVITAAALYYVPAVDQHRERSLVAVMPNGGNTETFHINVPFDRIMMGASGQSTALPAGFEWPDDEKLEGISAELFKVRNSDDAVIGVASRIEAGNHEADRIIEWVLHLPARGSVYLSMRPEAVGDGYRVGQLRAGTREFQGKNGQVTERWTAAEAESPDTSAGQIELVTAFIATAEGSR
ncbi:MAG: hypothetical protein ACO22K_04930 [Woeseiaceae bacterium]